jgi:signal transduction histidine kinase
VVWWGIGGYKYSSSTSKENAFLWWQIAWVSVIITPIIYYQFVYTFLKLNKKKYKVILLTTYFLGFIFLLFDLVNRDLFLGNLRFVFNQFYWVDWLEKKNFIFIFFYILFYWLLLIYAFLLLLKKYKISEGVERNQLKYFILGSLLGWLGPEGHFLISFGINIYPYSNILIAIYPLIFTYAILRYRLMDINIVIKRTAVYSLSAGLLASFFVVIVLAVTKYLTGFFGITSFAIMTIAAIVIALLSNPIKNRIQTIIDKIFYKKTYDYYSTLQKVSHELASTFNLKRIYGFIGDTISSALGLKNIYLLSLFPDKTYRMVYLTTYEKKDEIKSEKAVDIGRESSVREYNIENRIQESEGTINGKSEIVKLLKKSNDVVIREELPQIHKISQEVVDKVNTDLKPFKGEAVVPVFIDGKLELMMVLGEKLSGDIFTSEDIKLLHTISDQTAIAVRNARLYIDKLRSDRLASMGMISATFAHEIKNPLTSIKTFAQLLPERHSDTEFRENFSRIVIDGVNRIDGLIKDLLDFSSGKISVEMSALNVTGLMDNIIDEVVTQLQLKNKKISIEKDYENIEVDMSGDEKRLRQAFTNIILNGCQAIPDTRDDGKIRVSINPGEDNVGITIADNGDGIPPEDVPRIFEPFFSTKTIGAGLGLAITKKIIEDHYGKIEVDSILKKGTTFRITLPVKRMGAKVGNLSTA